MAIPLYLAQTATEFTASKKSTKKIAWMACHFSPYGIGLTNIPQNLPEGSLLILNDRTPPNGHDPKTVSNVLLQTLEQFHCYGILLDFQNTGCQKIVDEAIKLPCPVAVTEAYAKTRNCPVFLSAPPLNKPLTDYIQPWKSHEIWLEAAMNSGCIALTESGSNYSAATTKNEPCPFSDDTLHCRYRTEIGDDYIRFHLHRDRKELDALLAEAESLGITLAVGLYQELGDI